MAGYDSKGPHLCEVTATGFTTYVPFVSMGSGSLNAYSILESRYKDNMTLAEARQLAIDAIKAGIIYDNGSGSNVDFCEITDNNINYVRNHEIVGTKIERLGKYIAKEENIERVGVSVVPLKGGKTNEEGGNKIQEESVSRNSPDRKLDIEK